MRQLKVILSLITLSLAFLAIINITSCQKKQEEEAESVNKEIDKASPKLDVSKMSKPEQMADKIGIAFTSNEAMKQAIQMDTSEKRIKAVVDAYEHKLEATYKIVTEFNAIEKTEAEKLSAAQHFCNLLKQAEGLDPMLSGLENVSQEDETARTV